MRCAGGNAREVESESSILFRRKVKAVFYLLGAFFKIEKNIVRFHNFRFLLFPRVSLFVMTIDQPDR